MGRRWRRRNHRHSDDFQFQASDCWGQSLRKATIPIEDVPLVPYTVSGRGRRTQSNRNPFRLNESNPHQPQVFFQPTVNPFQRQRTSPTIPRMESDFRIRSNRFRQYILQTLNQTLNQTLRQVQQWYPDDEPVSESEMDWQPESELVIPQSAEKIHYIWDKEPAPIESALREEERDSPEVGIGLGISISTRERASSEGNNGLSPGWSPVPLEEWRSPPTSGFAVPRTMPSSPDVEIESRGSLSGTASKDSRKAHTSCLGLDRSQQALYSI